MEQNKPNIKPAPGLPEAIHPEIGNGAAWEDHKHEQLLRSPDPSKQLDHLLILDHLQSKEHILPEDTLEDEVVKSEPSSPVKKEIDAPDLISNNEINVREGYAPLPEESKGDTVKAKKKAKSKNEEKYRQEENPDWIKDTQEEEKSTQAGKLVRKAAKSVKRQEKEQTKAQETKLPQPEIDLSPFTRWLKGFAGSDYVHPYEDDFAFAQGSGPAGEGISETFADLLANQGYKEQAIEMYLKLMEKYPKKSGFFAAKIEALQQ